MQGITPPWTLLKLRGGIRFQKTRERADALSQSFREYFGVAAPSGLPIGWASSMKRAVTVPFPELFIPGARRQMMFHEESDAWTSLQKEGCRLPASIIHIVEKNYEGLRAKSYPLELGWTCLGSCDVLAARLLGNLLCMTATVCKELDSVGRFRLGQREERSSRRRRSLLREPVLQRRAQFLNPRFGVALVSCH